MRKSNKKNSLLNKIEKFQKNSKNAGITLLALVITIVILLIISTAAITFIVTSDIFTKAKFSTDSYNNSTEKENLELAKFNNEIENLQSTREDVQGASNPIGCIISQMGTTAPNGYLACDGSVYEINGPYLALAEYINTQFGSYDYFKIGSETVPEGQFKVPDLRGEFLRGTGTNSHNNSNLSTKEGSGASVGSHQEATSHYKFDGQNNNLWVHNFTAFKSAGSYDATAVSGRTGALSATHNAQSGSICLYSSRPTNTSVLYCIKY